MRRWMIAITFVALFVLMGLVAPASAGAQKHVINYIGGGNVAFSIPGPACPARDNLGSLYPGYTFGGTCTVSCPGGDAQIFVDDELYGTDHQFRVNVDNEPFYRGQLYESDDIIECTRISVMLDGNPERTSYGTITIE